LERAPPGHAPRWSRRAPGGVVYPRILDELIPEWWTEAPIQRWITRRATMLMTPTQALTVDFRTEAWGKPPYNGATAFRPDFDHWLASKAEAAGAELICSTTVVGLLRDAQGRVTGVRTDRPDGDLTAHVVIACDGVNSFIAKEAGLYGKVEAHNYTLGVKETLALPKEAIDERFGVRGNEGVDYEIVGATGEVNGGGFLYTNLDTIAVGVVLKLPKLAAQKRRPEEIIAALKAHSAIAPLVEGGEVKEYSAHLIPEAGWKMLPKLAGDGLLVAGDAAALCLAAGIWLEGVNFAMASGMYAGEAAAEALAAGDTSLSGLAGYRRRLEDTFVLKDHRKLQRAPELMLGDRMQFQYPQMTANIVERMFRVDNPAPKPGLRAVLREERKRSGVKLKDLARDGWNILRTFG
jgi:electron transfer flavoprotein-quinone oxidoreductase